MARDGSGNYNLPAGQPVSTGTTISSTVHNTLASDVAAALTASLAKDGQTTPTANLPMGGFKHTGVADGTARNQYGSLGQLQDGNIWNLGSVTGTNTITATLTPAITSYTGGMEIQMVPAATNTGAVTLSVNGLTAKDILKGNGVALAAGDLVAGIAATLVYINPTGWLLTNPQAPVYGGVTVTGAVVPANGMYLSAANTLAWSTNNTLGMSLSAGALTVVSSVTATSFSGSGASLTGVLKTANNLSDVTAATARTNLGVTATGADTTYMFRANNLSDIPNAATARTNLGVPSTTGTGANGTWGISISGNAATATSATSATTAGGITGQGALATLNANQAETRNISGKTGVTKTLSTSAASGGSDGDIWYRY